MPTPISTGANCATKNTTSSARCGDYTEAIRLAPQRRGRLSTAAATPTIACTSSAKPWPIITRPCGSIRTNAAAYTNRGDMYADFGRWANASSDYRTGLKLNPRTRPGLSKRRLAAGHLPRRGVYRNSSGALRAAEKAIQLDGETDYRYL